MCYVQNSRMLDILFLEVLSMKLYYIFSKKIHEYDIKMILNSHTSTMSIIREILYVLSFSDLWFFFLENMFGENGRTLLK